MAPVKAKHLSYHAILFNYVRFFFNINFILQLRISIFFEYTMALCFPLRKKKLNSQPRSQSAHTAIINITKQVWKDGPLCHPAHCLWQTNNLICNQPCAVSHTISSPSNQAQSAIQRKLINMTFQQGVWQTVGCDLFVERGVLNVLSQEYILLCPDPGSLKHESTPMMWRLVGTLPATH